MSGTPSWPSLYNLAVELFPIEHRHPLQPRGRYLHEPHDVFRFTLYWTFVLYVPTFIICGVYAFFNLSLPPQRPPRRGVRTRPGTSSYGSSRRNGSDGEHIPLRHYDRHRLAADTRDQGRIRLPARSPAKQNERRSRVTFALLVFLLFATFALGGAVVGSAIVGYVLAGLFKAANYNMSTWIPFLGALMQTAVGFLALWPTIIDII